jgi:hypothetical protein
MALDILSKEELTGVESQPASIILEDTKNAFIKMMVYICKQMESSNMHCLMCQAKLEEPSLKLRPCTRDVCEFNFEESFRGGLFSELSYFPHECHFDLSIAAKALLSARAATIFEPFPTFFLKKNELRDKRGNLDEIKKAQQKGVDVAKAKRTDEANKDIAVMGEIMAKLPSIESLIVGRSSEEELNSFLIQCYGGDQKKAFQAYKLMRYILATNRSSIRRLEPEEYFKLPEGNKDLFYQYVLIS